MATTPPRPPPLVLNLSDGSASSKENAQALTDVSSEGATRRARGSAKSPSPTPADDDFLGVTAEDIQEVFTAFKSWASPRSDKQVTPTRAALRRKQDERERRKKREQQQQVEDGTNSMLGEHLSEPGQIYRRGAKNVRKGLLKVLEVCNCSADTSPLSTMQKMMDEIGRLEHGMADSLEFGDAPMSGSVDTADREAHDEMQQISRLTSWGTLQTCETAGTEDSYGTAFTAVHTIVVDDDGNPIDSRLLEKTIEASQKRAKRKRVVKFDYPPVSAFRECPRLANEDIQKMFFSPEELDQIEDDRASTSVADDVEVVAVAATLEDASTARSTKNSPKNVLRGGKNNNKNASSSSSPRVGGGGGSITNIKPSKYSYDSEAAASPRSIKSADSSSVVAGAAAGGSHSHVVLRPPTPPLKSSHNNKFTPRLSPRNVRQGSVTVVSSDATSSSSKQHQQPATPVKENKRLVQSVQIFLRERSTGNSSRREF